MKLDKEFLLVLTSLRLMKNFPNEVSGVKPFLSLVIPDSAASTEKSNLFTLSIFYLSITFFKLLLRTDIFIDDEDINFLSLFNKKAALDRVHYQNEHIS